MINILWLIFQVLFVGHTRVHDTIPVFPRSLRISFKPSPVNPRLLILILILMIIRFNRNGWLFVSNNFSVEKNITKNLTTNTKPKECTSKILTLHYIFTMPSQLTGDLGQVQLARHFKSWLKNWGQYIWSNITILDTA